MSGFYDEENGLCSSESDSQSGNSSNMSVDPSNDSGMSSSNSGGSGGGHSGGSIFYPDLNSQNMTMADGSCASQSNQASKANSSNVCSFYDYGNSLCAEPGAANMSQNDSAGNGGGNFYSGLYSSNGSGSGATGGYSYDRGMSYITDIPISPHLVLEGAGVDVTTDQPTLDILLVGPDGSMSGENITLKSDQKGRLHWNAKNATNALVNGEAVPLNGSIDIPFNKLYIGTDMPYEIVVWKNKQENSTIRLLSIKMSDKVAVGISEEVNFKVKKTIGNGKSFKYWDISGEVEFKVVGKFTSSKSDSSNAGVSNNDASVKTTIAKLSQQIDFMTLQCSLKGSFKIPKDVTPKDDNEKSVWAELGASADTSAVFKIGKTCEVIVSGSLVLVNVKIARNKDGFQWECKCGQIEISLEDSDKFTYKCDDGVFDLSFQFSGKIKAEPNWSAIIAEACADYGETLGIDALTAGLGVTAAVVTSPAVIVSAVVATIVIGYSEILATEDLLALRDTIPKYAKKIASGVKAGLQGTETMETGTKVIDEQSAYLAGVAAGTKKRQDLANNNEPFDKKTPDQKSMIIADVESQCTFKMHSAFYSEKANSIKNSLSYDSTKLKDQVSAWNNIIGGSTPYDRGGAYLELWKRFRPDAPGVLYYDGRQ